MAPAQEFPHSDQMKCLGNCAWAEPSSQVDFVYPIRFLSPLSAIQSLVLLFFM